MQNLKLWLIGGGTILAVGLLIAWGFYEGKQEEAAMSEPDASILYYYGAECPHCKKINEFLESNDVASKLAFTKKEVWHNKKNSQEMQERAKSCGLQPSQVGVPFVFNSEENKCFIGEPDVQKFFSEKAGLTPTESPEAQ